MIQAFRPGVSQNVTVSTTASAPLALTANMPLIRVATLEAGVRVAIGRSPVADANSMYMPPDSVEYFSVYNGDRISFLGAVSTTVNVTNMGK